MKGSEIQDGIAALARTHGWRAVHFSPGRVKGDRYVTVFAYDSKGWPDLFLVHPGWGRLLAIEVKGDGDSLTAEQDEWLLCLRLAGVETAVITSNDWKAGVADDLLKRR